MANIAVAQFTTHSSVFYLFAQGTVPGFFGDFIIAIAFDAAGVGAPVSGDVGAQFGFLHGHDLFLKAPGRPFVLQAGGVDGLLRTVFLSALHFNLSIVHHELQMAHFVLRSERELALCAGRDF